MRVLVMGSDSTIGECLISKLKRLSGFQILSWSFDACQTSEDSVYSGLESLPNAVCSADVVVNVHENTNYTILPDVEVLDLHNVKVVQSLLQSNPANLVHLSSAFVQCSSWWPNTYEPESSAEKYRHDWPFQKYCESKARAEKLIRDSGIPAYIIRAVPSYGKPVKTSVISDIIKISSIFGCIPRLGDKDGCMQMIYIDNLVDGLIKSIQTLVSRSSREMIHDVSCNDSGFQEETSFCKSPLESSMNSTPNSEVILLCDNTPVGNVYDIFGGCMTKGVEKRRMVDVSYLFIPLFYCYLLLAAIIRFLDGIVRLPSLFRQLPDPNYLYVHIRHWSLFNTEKAKFLLKFRPPFNAEECLKNSEEYYHLISPEEIRKFSWQSNL